MSEVKKVTKKENYEMLMEIVENSNSEMKAELVDFITKQIGKNVSPSRQFEL